MTIPDPAEEARALKLLSKTKAACLVSRALSVQQTFEAVVTVAAATPVS